MGKPLSHFFHIKPVRFQSISRTLLVPLPVPWKGPWSLSLLIFTVNPPLLKTNTGLRKF